MISPCILVCALDPATGYCLGCGRTGDEIGRWVNYTDSERRALMERLPARLADLGTEASLANTQMTAGGRQAS